MDGKPESFHGMGEGTALDQVAACEEMNNSGCWSTTRHEEKDSDSDIEMAVQF